MGEKEKVTFYVARTVKARSSRSKQGSHVQVGSAGLYTPQDSIWARNWLEIKLGKCGMWPAVRWFWNGWMRCLNHRPSKTEPESFNILS